MTAIGAQLRAGAAAGWQGSQAVLLVIVAGITVVCGAGGVRPRFAPFHAALSDTVTASPDSVIMAAAAVLQAEGIEVHHVRPREGFLETHWFDAGNNRRVRASSLGTDALTIIRLWADAVTERRTLVVGEAARPLVVDPSLPTREREVPVAEDEPGHQVMLRVFEQVMAAFAPERTP
jgi:hypothetical protein